MTWLTDDRVHHVSCTLHSGPESPGSDFEEVQARCDRLVAYARRLGFGVMYENVDRAE